MADQVIGVTIKGIGDFSDVVSNVGSVQKALTKLKLPDKLGDSLNKNISNFMKEYDKYQKKIAEGIHTQGDQNAVNKSLNSMLNSYEKIVNEFGKLSKKDFKDIFNLDDSAFASVQKRIKDIQAEIKKIKIDSKQLAGPMAEIAKMTNAKAVIGGGKGLDKLQAGIDAHDFIMMKEAIVELETYYDRFSSKMSESKKLAMKDEIEKLKAPIEAAIQATDHLEKEAKELDKQFDNIGTGASKELGEVSDALNKTTTGASSVVAELKKIHEEEFSFNREAQNIDRQIQSYFGLSQMIRKVGDIAKDAFATVKELDKAMTETAVVTNYDVGDMWSMLPTYTKQANQLGSTIKDVYEAATLYYQQGLNTNQAMGLANETLKMARIAGLGAAEATDMMTAALRGFNMEINQQSAQKINDIYSELAAITASDTAEIGSAMERTASIANSANMDFATTSAFLAQMIETTREAPENLGTAMKTIVARFQEMKQDPTKLIDSEGVAMDANKVDKALKTIGVQLMDTKGEFRDLDDVFLDISSRWDSLTQGQQRYIATIAAGSRQQSRFIAMMSNYERTMELVDAANNSAGASQRQFEKTLDSMEAKLNKLKNAWDQFTMGLMNNQILKTGVDLLTGAFTIINKIIDTLGSIPSKPFEGITKSVLTLVTTLGMLQLGKRGSRGLVQGAVGWWKEGKSFGKTFAEGWAGPEGTKAAVRQSKYGDAIKASIISAKIPQTIQGEFQKGKVLATAAFSSGAQLIALSNIINESELDAEAKALGQRIRAEIEAEIQNGQLNPNALLPTFNYRFAQEMGTTEHWIKPAELAEATEGVEKLGTSFNKAELKIYKAGNALQMFGSQIGGPIGNLLVHVGNTMIMLGDQAIDLAKKVKKAAEAAKGVDTLTGKGKAFGKEMFPGAEKALKIFGKIPLPLKLIAAALAVIGITWGIVAHQQKKAIEDAASAAAAASEAYDSAKQETSELSDAIEQIKTNEDAFDGLVVGTAAFNEQLIQTNQQITELLNKYPQLNDAKYLSTDKNGLMHITDAGFDMIKEYQKQRQANASALNLLQTADLNTVETTQKAARMRQLKFGESGADESYKQRVQEANLLEQQVAAQKEVAKVTAVNTALVDKEIHSREQVSAIIADSYDARKAEIKLQGESIHDLKQEYADFYGYKYDKSTKKLTDIEGNEIEVDDSTVKDAIKEIRVIADIEADAKSLDGMINTIDTRFSKSLGESFEGSAHLFSDILSNNLEIDNDLLNNLVSHPDKLNEAVNSLSEKEIAAVLGVSADAVANAPEKYKNELVDKVAQKAQNIIETQTKSYEDLAGMLAQTRVTNIDELIDENGKFVTREQVHNKAILERQLKNIDAQDKLLMSKVGSTLRDTMGTDVMKNYIGFMGDLYQNISRHQFGNIDLDKREIQKNADGTISTVLGSWGTYGKNEIPIAFSPMLQTGTGTPEKLNQSTIDKYINTLMDKTGGDTAEMLKLDASGLLIDGKYIKGLIADIGDTAESTAEKMHTIEVDKEAAQEIENIFNEANLDTAIGRLDAFTKLSNSSIDTVQELGNSLLESTDSANLLGEAFEEFYDSNDFQELAKNMDNFTDASGRVNAASVQEMAKQCSSLNRLLDTGAISAGGVAAALNAMGANGNLTILDLNKHLLDFLSTANQLQDVLSEAHSLIENFDWGIDTGESEDFAKNSTKQWKELYDNGEFGNQQLENYAKFVLGQERWNKELEKSGGDIEVALNSMSKDILKYSDGFEQAWVDMANSSADKYKNVHWENGDVIWDTNGRTTEQLAEDLATARGITLEWAKLMVEDFANYSYDFKTELARNDFNAGLDKYLPERTGKDGTITATLSELKTLADAQGVSVDDLKQQIADYKGIDVDQLNILENIDEHGQALLDEASIADLNKEYSESTTNTKDQSWLSEYKQLNAQGVEISNTTDLKSAISGAVADGLPDEQANEMARVEALELLDNGTRVFYDGVELFESDLADAATFADKISEITDNAKWKQVGAAIAQGAIEYFFPGKKKKGDDSNKNNDKNAGNKKDGGTGNQAKAPDSTPKPIEFKIPEQSPAFKYAEEHDITYNVHSNDKELKDTQKTGEELEESANNGINYNITTNDEEISDSQEKVDNLSAMMSSPFAMYLRANYPEVAEAYGLVQNVQATSAKGSDLQARSDSSQIDATKRKISSIAGKVFSTSLSVSAGGALSTLQKIWNLIVKIKNNKSSATHIGGGGGHAEEGAYKGRNNHGIASIPVVGSAARGGYGRLGPKGKGGPTLTGELGYEIAWLPDENRSMILGANGPQMVDLPGNAVVWTHEQSKKIMSQKAIPAGSHAGRHINPTPTPAKGKNNGGGGGGGHHTTPQVDKVSEVVIKTSGKVFSWWEKISRQVKAAEKEAKKLGDQTTKVFNDLRASIADVNEVNKEFIKAQQNTIKLNQNIINNSNKKLNTLDTGTSNDKYIKAKSAKEKADKKVASAKKAYKKNKSKKNKRALEKAEQKQKDAKKDLNEATPKDVKQAKKEYNKAQKAYKKKKSKKNKKALNKAKAKYEKADAKAAKKGANWETVEWEQTKKTTKKGKTKKTKVTKKESIDLSKYIKKDKDGNYYVDKAKIDALGKQNKAKAKAVQKAAYEQIDKYQGRKDEAEENITSAQDQLADYRKQIDDTFFGWKNELTQVLRISSEIERTEARINDLKVRQERTQFYLDNLDLSKGTEGTNGDLKKYFNELGEQTKKNIELNNDENKLRYEKIEANKKEMASMGELTDQIVSYEDINGEVQKESENDMYKRISNIIENGTGLGWDELSTQEKKIFARQEAFQRGIIVGNPEDGYSLNKGKEGEGGLVDYLAAIGNGEIQEELGSLLQEVWDDVNEKTLENIDLQTEIYSTETDNLKLYKDYQDTAKQISEQLYGWKNTLTKVLELTNKIEQSEKRLNYLKTADELFNKQMLSGESVSTADILATYVGQIVEVVSEVENLDSKLGEQRADLQSYLTGDDIYRQINNLSAEAPTEANIARLEELQKQLEVRRLALNYGTITQNADGTVSTTYDSAKIEKDLGSKFDAETAKEIEQFYQDLNEKSGDIRDTMQSSLDKISELQQSLIDLRQSYADSAEKLLNAYVNQQQKIIDNIKTLYSSIDSHFKELISDTKQTLQLTRQNQDNAKTEEDISKKQQRLAMLRADTSGGNQVAIAQLQKEIADTQQSYGRTLEDQLLDKISMQGDVAARQRQRQIDLMQAQHNIAKNTGTYAAQINQWLSDPAGFRSTIVGILTEEAGVKAMTAEKRAITLAEIDKELTDFTLLPSKIDATTSAIGSLETLIKGDKKSGQNGLASEIGNTIKTGVTNISNKLAIKLFGDPEKKKGDTGALGKIKSSIDKVSTPITNALTTGVESKLLTETTNTSGINTTLTGKLDTKLSDVAKKIDSQEIKVEVKIDANSLTPTTNTTVTATETTPSTPTPPASSTPPTPPAPTPSTPPASTPTVEPDDATDDNDNEGAGLSQTEAELAYKNALLAAEKNKKTSYTEIKKLKQIGKDAGHGVGRVLQDLANTPGITWKQILSAVKGKFSKYRLAYTFDSKNFKKAYNEVYGSGKYSANRTTAKNSNGKYAKYKFASGGIADYTGPAWLDGTPSKPELVLNAKDTQNFLALRDVLSKAIGSADSITSSYSGNATYEININVDHLNNDYDVDKVAERVKKIIVKDSSYRNVTQVRNFR